MKNISLMTWDSSPNNTYRFKLITRITTLGSPDELKSILGFYINTNQETLWTSTTPTGHMLKISYRTDTGNQWIAIDDANNSNGTIGTREAQGFIKGDVSINDFGLLYRKYRDTSASTLDEN